MKRSGQVDRLGGGGGVRWVDQRGWRDGSGGRGGCGGVGHKGALGERAKLRGREPNQRRVRAAADNWGSHHASN